MADGTSRASFFRPSITMKNSDVSNNPNDKNSSEQYFGSERRQDEDKDEFRQSEFVDRSAQLRATLNSLASLNAASVINTKLKKKEREKEQKKD